MLFGVESGWEPVLPYVKAAAKTALKRRSIDGIRRTLAALSPPSRFPRLEEYERGATCRGSGMVIFQTRAWDPATGTDPTDREMINENRAELIQALRSELGPRFMGGFISDEFSRQYYGDLVTTGASDRSQYLKRIRSADIGIASLGLHRSTPFKVPEYLAAGRAVLTEPLYYKVGPDPGSAILEFSSIDECVTQIDQLLAEPKTLAHRQDLALAYWREHVRPDRIMLRMLSQVFK